MHDLSSILAPQLRALAELAAHNGHMTQAAAALGMPQSSMSRRIHALEATLRTPLLVRDGRTVRLTPAALALTQRTRDPLRQLDDALNDLVSTADPNTGTVRFGFPLTMGSGPMPDLLAAFRREHPGIRLQLRQAHGSALFDDLRTGDLDLAVTIPAPDDLHHATLGAQDICVVVWDQHPLARRKAVALAELRSETFIANPPSYNLRQVTGDWCQDVGFAPAIAVEITEFATIRELIARHLGIALLPRTGRPVPGTVELPLHGGPYTRDISLAWATDHPTPATQRLTAFILDRNSHSAPS